MTCHNSNGWAACLWAERMISGSINREHVCSLSALPWTHLHVCVTYGRLLFLTYFQWQVYFYILLFFGFYSAEFWNGAELQKCMSPGCFCILSETGTWNNGIFYPPLSQAWPSFSLEEGLPSLVWINKFVRQKEQIKANEVVQRQKPVSWGFGLRSGVFFFTFFFNLRFFFPWSMLRLGKMWGGNTKALLIIQKAEAKAADSCWTGWLLQLTAARHRGSKSSVSLCLGAPEKRICRFHLHTCAGTCIPINSCSFPCLY